MANPINTESLRPGSNAGARLTLRWNPNPGQVTRYLILCAILSGASIAVSYLAVLTIPGGFLGIGALYFASVFYALATYWFGGWGLIASFVGAFIGAGVLTGMPAVFALPFAVADIWEPVIPFVLLRTIGHYFNLDALAQNAYSSVKSAAFFVIFGALLPPLLSGLWGVWILNIAGFVPDDAFQLAVFSWWAGAALLLALFVPAISRLLSPFLNKTGWLCRGIWS